jgi:hypothetical protein
MHDERTEKIQVKITGEVIIPDDLLGFFREVDDLIKHNDEVTIIESDDLIQTEFAYGGLLEEGADRFRFTYFPEENTRPKWNIELTASEIAKIAEGEKRTLTLWKCQNPNCRSFFSSESETCFDCDYVDDGQEEKQRVLNMLSQSPTRESWVEGYLKDFPDAVPLEVICDYNSQVHLGKKWGNFSLNEMQNLIEKLRDQNAN